MHRKEALGAIKRMELPVTGHPEFDAPMTITEPMSAPVSASASEPAPAPAPAQDAASLAPGVVHEIRGQGGAVERYIDKTEGADAGFAVDVNGDGPGDSELDVMYHEPGWYYM
jgi:hypothetical protein